MTCTTQTEDCTTSKTQQEQGKRVGQCGKFESSGSEKSAKVKSGKLVSTQPAARANFSALQPERHHQKQLQPQELRAADANCNAAIGRASAADTVKLLAAQQQQQIQTHNYTTSIMNDKSILQPAKIDEVENKKVATAATAAVTMPHCNTNFVQARQLQQLQQHRQPSSSETKSLSESYCGSSSNITSCINGSFINNSNSNSNNKSSEWQQTSKRCTRSITSYTQLFSVLLLLVAEHLPTGVVSFNHSSGCQKCWVTGSFNQHRMSFQRIDARRRTDEEFRSRADDSHHKNDSPLERLPIDMVSHFPVADSLHLVDVGVMKRCLLGWMQGNFNYVSKWSAFQISEVSKRLASCKLPSEIQRSVRTLDCIHFWKALEFRTFLLYLGPVLLKDFLPSTLYQHFLKLFCAVLICSSKYYLTHLTDLAESLLAAYVIDFGKLYGKDFMGSNVHNLCHLVEDVRQFGVLSSFSSYPFENYLSYIKRFLRIGNRPLAQLAKRLIEKAKYTKIENARNSVIVLKKETNLNCTTYLIVNKFLENCSL